MASSTSTIDQAIQYGKQVLTNSDTARLDSELLLLKVLNDSALDNLGPPKQYYTKTWLMTWPETLLTEQQYTQYKQYLHSRAQGKPIAYIIGSKDFWSLTLKVSPDTLIPRPETELLVECALEKIPSAASYTIIDLGTGSGAIALALAAEKPESQLIATDISLAALEMAKKNALNLDIKNVSFYQSHWFDELPTLQCDLIISNPPYISDNDPQLEDNVRYYEPLSALLSDHNGLKDIKEIINNSSSFLKSAGWLLIEHGYQQGPQAETLFLQYGYIHVQTVNDLNDLPRVTMGQWYSQ